MEQVSPEVKEAYLNNLTYATISKKDWKVLSRAYNEYNAMNKQDMFDRFMFILSGLTIVMAVIISSILNNLAVLGFLLLFFIPLSLAAIEDKFGIIYDRVRKNDEFLCNYRKANDSFYVLIEGNDKYRYYSRWYLELINPKVKAYESQILKTGLDVNKRYIHFNEIGEMAGYESLVYEIQHVTRHPDRFNWRNTLSTNRVLSIKEYKNLIKSKEEFKKYMEMEEDIKEFQEYNVL